MEISRPPCFGLDRPTFPHYLQAHQGRGERYDWKFIVWVEADGRMVIKISLQYIECVLTLLSTKPAIKMRENQLVRMCFILYHCY